VWFLCVHMGHRRTKPPFDVRLGKVAEAQHGVVSDAGLRALGLGRGGIARRTRTGRLYREHPGVCRVGQAPLTREGRFMAAVLACGEGAVLSRR
jgi:hypothetical protein